MEKAKTTLKIEKETTISGDVWYRVFINSKYQNSFASEESAREMVDQIKSNIALAKKEIILEETV